MSGGFRLWLGAGLARYDSPTHLSRSAPLSTLTDKTEAKSELNVG